MIKSLPSHLRKAYLTVSQRPSTLHESSTILAHLTQRYGPVVYFRPLCHDPIAKACIGDAKVPSDTRAIIYQILFDVKHVSTVKKAAVNDVFQVTLPASNPDVEDPFNVRGLHGRMPTQAKPVTFECELTDTAPVESVRHIAIDEWPTTTVLSSSPYKAAKQGPIFDALQDTGAPRGLTRNLVQQDTPDNESLGTIRRTGE